MHNVEQDCNDKVSISIREGKYIFHWMWCEQEKKKRRHFEVDGMHALGLTFNGHWVENIEFRWKMIWTRIMEAENVCGQCWTAMTHIQRASGRRNLWFGQNLRRWKNVCNWFWTELQWRRINQNPVSQIDVLLSVMWTGMEEAVPLDIISPRMEEVEIGWDQSWVEPQWEWVN